MRNAPKLPILFYITAEALQSQHLVATSWLLLFLCHGTYSVQYLGTQA